MWHKIFAGVYFRRLAIFCVLWEVSKVGSIPVGNSDFFSLSHVCDKLITPFLKLSHVVETQHYLFIFFINRFAQDCKDTVNNAHENFAQERTNMMLQD